VVLTQIRAGPHYLVPESGEQTEKDKEYSGSLKLESETWQTGPVKELVFSIRITED
jgi:hypothetical protein